MRFRLLIAALCSVTSLWAQDEPTPSKERPEANAERKPERERKPKQERKPEQGRKPQKPPTDSSPLTADERATLVGILAKAGAEDAELKVVERTATRQARVMYALAKEDIEHARDMYCPAGDAVLERFDPQQGEAANVARMEEELLRQLPRARELGCLNHIKNDDVLAIDVAIEAVGETRHQELMAAAKNAVAAGKIERFLHPPSHPGAFHFELPRRQAKHAAQNDAAQKDTAQKDTAQNDAARNDAAQNDAAQKDTAQNDAARKSENDARKDPDTPDGSGDGH